MILSMDSIYCHSIIAFGLANETSYLFTRVVLGCFRNWDKKMKKKLTVVHVVKELSIFYWQIIDGFFHLFWPLLSFSLLDRSVLGPERLISFFVLAKPYSSFSWNSFLRGSWYVKIRMKINSIQEYAGCQEFHLK